MNGVRGIVAGLVGLFAGAALAAGAAGMGGQVPVDRWLVAPAAAPDSLDADARLAADLLGGPGEAGVLPDRGSSAAGLTWRLARRDGAADLPLDSLFPDARPGAVVYAHSYIRLPADRTLRVGVEGRACTGVRAWLNGREVPNATASARLGAGWNTLLVKAVAGDCPFGFEARLVDPAGAGAAAGADPPTNVRVQASRPHGNVRTGPDDWVVPADSARVEPAPLWRDDRLHAGLAIGLTSWGRAPVADVELELRDGADGRATAAWLVPGRPDEVVIPVRLDRLERLLEDGRIGLRLRWGDEQTDHVLRVTGAAPDVSEPAVLDGWAVLRTTGLETSARAGGRLPAAAGWSLAGRWKVPEALGGRTLALDARDAPGAYTLDGTALDLDADGTATLCSPCRRGRELRLEVATSAAWEHLPRVLVAASAGPE